MANEANFICSVVLLRQGNLEINETTVRSGRARFLMVEDSQDSVKL